MGSSVCNIGLNFEPVKNKFSSENVLEYRIDTREGTLAFSVLCLSMLLLGRGMSETVVCESGFFDWWQRRGLNLGWELGN